MHELFLTAHINNNDVPRTVRILQGYCGMKPVTLIQRRLIWACRGSVGGGFANGQLPLVKQLWAALNEQISRQAYVLTTLFDVNQEEFGKITDGKPTLDQLPGTVKWIDLPDPAGARPVNSRLAVHIDDQKGLCTLLQSGGHRLTREMIQESFRFIHNNIILELSRYLELPAQEPKPLVQLPPFQELSPFDANNKWILSATVRVMNGADAEQINQGSSELMALKGEFDGCFDFHMIDRHTLDTRVKK